MFENISRPRTIRQRKTLNVRKSLNIKLMAFVFFICFPFGALAQEVSDSVAPELSSGISQNPLVLAKSHMVSTANPHASKAGMWALEQGGNAIDAMVAVQLTLGLVEPQSSGLGGGAFLIYFDAEKDVLTSFDGRETAPAAATADMFIGADGKPLKFYDAVVGGLSVGTPGTLKLLYEVHQKYGQLEWHQLFKPAQRLAEEGFEVSPRLNKVVSDAQETLRRFAPAREYFFNKEGEVLAVGSTLRNPEYAKTLKAIAKGGDKAFYTGEIARRIVETVRLAPDALGKLSLQDLREYQIIERPPVCYNYRGYDVCGMGPPSSGALTIGQILGMLEGYNLQSLGPNNPESWRLIGDASRLAFADRGLYMADSDFVNMPEGLLNRSYLKNRGLSLAHKNALSADEVSPGTPPYNQSMIFASDESLELPSTSHFSIIDENGNIVSMTTTIENGFGSRLMVGGFLLNNELTDFSFVAEKQGKLVANRIEPQKRPRSSMSPTIIFKDGEPVLAIGSPGGSRIIPYVAKTIIAWLDWEMDIQDAIELPHLVNRFGTYDVEIGTEAEKLVPALEKLGYKVNARDLNSGLHGIEITRNGLEGGADPRREGLVLGK